MDKPFLFLVFFVFFFTKINAQDFGLSPDRVRKIKSATVRIIVNRDSISGTGFIIEGGHVVTCYHVVKALYTGKENSCSAIFSDGEIVPLKRSPLADFGSNLDSMRTYDFFVLEFARQPQSHYSILKLGKWSDAKEGDLAYTCGYPFAISQQILALGIVSTKFNRRVPLNANYDKQESIICDRAEAWLDMTVNNGNSGGAIIRVGKTSRDDGLIGIIDYKLNPYVDTLEKLKKLLHRSLEAGNVYNNGVDSHEVERLFAEAIAKMSVGVSGCISIDYLRRILPNN